MKLTPKPQPKAPATSPANSSMLHADKTSSSTVKRQTPHKVILDGVLYTGVDQQGQAVATEYQKSQQKTPPTKISCAIITPEEVSGNEEVELFNLGVLMAQMKWITVHTNCQSVLAGVARGEGVTDGYDPSTPYDRAILYKTTEQVAAQQILRLDSEDHLRSVVGEAATELYRRGVLR